MMHGRSVSLAERPQFVKASHIIASFSLRNTRKQTNGTAHLQRLHRGLHRRRTSTLRRIASARGRKINAILSNGDVPYAAAYRASMVPTGSGGIAFSILPGGFRFLSPRRKEQPNYTGLYGNMHTSMQFGTVTLLLPQSPSVTAPSRRELMCVSMKLITTTVHVWLERQCETSFCSLRTLRFPCGASFSS